MSERPMLKTAPYINKLVQQHRAQPTAQSPQDLEMPSVFASFKAREELWFPSFQQYDTYQVVFKLLHSKMHHFSQVR